MCHIYNQPLGSNVINNDDIDFFEILERGIFTYKSLGKNIYNWDFNSRTGDNSDILDYDIYLEEEDIYADC